MITRLKVDGFKNLVDVDVHFGAFNVITGANGIGKSNLFDVIYLVNKISTTSIRQGILNIRSADHNPQDLFFKTGDGQHSVFSISVELIADANSISKTIKNNNVDSIFRYGFECQYNEERGIPDLLKEKLESVKFIVKDYKNKELWINSIIVKKTAKDKVYFHGSQEKISVYPPYPKKSFSMVNFSQYEDTLLHSIGTSKMQLIPSATVAVREVENWSVIDFQNISIQANSKQSDPDIFSEGLFLASIIKRISKTDKIGVYKQISNRLFELTGEIVNINILEIKETDQLVLQLQYPDGSWHSGRSISEGTLRFLALAALESDKESSGAFCIEQPEDGIHPSRIPAMMRLLKDIAMDTTKPIGPDNPFRQVIVNTHSPLIASLTPEDSLIVVTPVHALDEQGREFVKPKFCGLKGTWREKVMPIVSVSALRPFLDIVPVEEKSNVVKRVADRDDVKRLLYRFREREAES